MKTICVAIATLSWALSLGVLTDAWAQVFTDLGQPFLVVDIWDLTPSHTAAPDTIYGALSTGFNPGQPGYRLGRLIRYHPPGYGNFTHMGSWGREVVFYSATTGNDYNIYVGTGRHAHLLCYVPGTGLYEVGNVLGASYICDLTRSFMPGDNRIFGGTAYNGHFFQYDPDVSPPSDSFHDWLRPVAGETGVWAVTSGPSVADWIIGGTSPNGYLFHFGVEYDTTQGPTPFEIIYPPIGEPIQCLTSGLASGPTAGMVYGATIGSAAEDTTDTTWTEQPGGSFFEYEPSTRELTPIGSFEQGSITAMTTGTDDMIYFAWAYSNTDNARLCRWDPTDQIRWNPQPYPWEGNPQWWELPPGTFPDAIRIRSLRADATWPGGLCIYGGTGSPYFSYLARLFRFTPPPGDGGGSQTALIGEADAPLTLFQNWPNPFTTVTSIQWSVSTGLKDSRMTLCIYDLSGRLVKTLVDEALSTEHSALNTGVWWNGRDAYGKEVPQGIYFYQLEVGGLTETRKMTLLR